MVGKLLGRLFGSRNDRMVRRMSRAVERISALEAEYAELTDADLQGKTAQFRERLAAGESLDDLLPEAFAVVREAGKRVLGMRHFDVQLVGGMVLHQGKIAEMQTGEGKTLVATLAAYLNALTGKGVHVITVNDYLARRDAEWMGRLYGFLGLTTGVVVPGMDHAAKQAAYAADIIYGTNNEFGFDYLRDNMAFSLEERVQRPLHYAIVDEVDSILIDEARTPLIISGPTDDTSELYRAINDLIPRFRRQEEEDGPGDYVVDEKHKQVHFTEEGHQNVEEVLVREGLLREGTSLYEPANLHLLHHLNACLRAHAIFRRDVDYIVKDGEIVIVDEFTGRTMAGRRWSDGLHQAMEAKEGVPVKNENQTLASITFQNYFRLYDKLAGMTGTADTEAYEFQQIYGLEVVAIPTNKPMIREDLGDLVYLTAAEKFEAIIADIRDCQERGQPVLVGTASIETSEYLSQQLKKAKIDHEVLNAKQHEREAQIIAQAGRPGAVTIATNMAGRGTDIVLGGSLDKELAEVDPEDEVAVRRIRADWEKRHATVLEAGGLHVVGTERHESRRIDNQLRGRSGRQGDPGSTRFYLSLEDSLLRIFASDRISGLMQKLGMEHGEAIEHPWVSRAIENAQRKVEGHNFDIRKQLLEYDNVANDQRKVIYGQRAELLHDADIRETVETVRHDVLTAVAESYVPRESVDEQWDLEGLEHALRDEFGLDFGLRQWVEAQDMLDDADIRQKVLEEADAAYAEKAQLAGDEALRRFEKAVMLQVLDSHWKDHLAAMDHLRRGIHLRGFAAKDPKQEYKREAFHMFAEMLDRIKHEVTGVLLRVRVQPQESAETVERRQRPAHVHYEHASVAPFGAGVAAADEADEPEAAPAGPQVREGRKVGRNEVCPCGSGKKYKRCHGQLG